jgi:hypothetical protein
VSSPTVLLQWPRAKERSGRLNCQCHRRQLTGLNASVVFSSLPLHVRPGQTPKSSQRANVVQSPLSDMRQRGWHVSFVPTPKSASSRSEANEGRQDCSKRPYVALGCVALRSVALWCKAVWRVAFAVRRETYVDSYWAAQSPPQAAHENIVLGTQ